jgi:hypothetical protein
LIGESPSPGLSPEIFERKNVVKKVSLPFPSDNSFWINYEKNLGIVKEEVKVNEDKESIKMTLSEENKSDEIVSEEEKKPDSIKESEYEPL